ncbi:MAG: transcriptional regulator, TetR family [Acidimicrobiales bacterium]|jgi:AcrR family transcriptional regulator|nr:transcriptional regulator, TetR family [Acidimicrobiales bacterium]
MNAVGPVPAAATIDATVDDARPRSGRPRDPSRDEAILAAALAIFAEEGYAGVSIEGVAARAGVGKATIYRRYPTKAQLMVEAVRAGACFTDHLPDTGDVRADLATMMGKLIDVLRSDAGPVLVSFAAERIRHRELDDEFTRSVIGAKRVHARQLVADAIRRGDLPPGTDIEVVVEIGPALIWHHALNGLPITDDLPDRILDLVLPRH